MKTIEFNPNGKSTKFPRQKTDAAASYKNEVFREILPLIFHKLKNKLTPILGYAQILQSRSDDEFLVDRLRRIERNTVELTELLNIVKDYFKVDPTPRRPGRIHRVLRELDPFWQKLANDEKIRIVLELDAEAPELLIDQAQLKILLLNMTENAVTALKAKNSENKEIRLAIHRRDDFLALLIRDNGSGMSQEDLGNIWAPFFSRFPEHAGLGLVVCEKIIANHDAVCRVTSAPGEFSQFEICFPLTANAGKKQKRSGDEDPRSQS